MVFSSSSWLGRRTLTLNSSARPEGTRFTRYSLTEGVFKTKQADGEIHEDQLNFLVNRLDEEVSPR